MGSGPQAADPDRCVQHCSRQRPPSLAAACPRHLKHAGSPLFTIALWRPSREGRHPCWPQGHLHPPVSNPCSLTEQLCGHLPVKDPPASIPTSVLPGLRLLLEDRRWGGRGLKDALPNL